MLELGPLPAARSFKMQIKKENNVKNQIQKNPKSRLEIYYRLV